MDWSFQELQAEVEEKSSDLRVFTEARDLIRKRVTEVADSHSRLTPLASWSGTDAVLGSLDLAIHAMERTLDELRLLMQSIPEEPRLRLVTENDHEHES